ncbi:uncharacterized protein LOC130954599 [Arachis stenosperma]|uniref:uncharacterized protein LOC130954599 n=1 Tax=Arachis stenosperma TaxID=217475 RepID=UPI0025AD7D21|nr:uncharacterized protein LOC130954599 [Arachis stenosperma]XP_057737340.1 uncharacterized protein LOC130954599 [Arachis stenosperma]XP_057737341.1 uncharacterized protein LOC130954599 [Arachis stenosperma]
MELDDTEIIVATYIFGTNKDNEFGRQEILAKGYKFDATRDSFFNLIPKGWIDQTILDVYAHMLNDEEKTTSKVLRHWYMSTVFLQMALSGTIPSSQVQEDYKEAFMGKVEVLRKALYLKGMLQHDSFYDFESTIRSKVSGFPILEALGIRRQRNDSFDCGIWVATWMKNCIWIDDYNIYVDDATRMRIAIDLIMKPYNLKKKHHYQGC